MVEKLRKLVITIVLAIIFIGSNCMQVYAALDTENIEIYSKGDKFILVKNAYKYIIKDVAWWKEAEYDEDYKEKVGYFCEKDDIVTYTGTYQIDNTITGKTTYYVEVKNKKGEVGFIHSANVDPYEVKLERPATIKKFISKNNIKTIEQCETKVKEYVAKSNDESIQLAINEATKAVNEIGESQIKKDEKLKKYEKLYSDYKNEIPTTDKNDSRFMAIGYVCASGYLGTSGVNGDVDDENADFAAIFDKAYKDYKNAKNDVDKEGAYQTMKTAYYKLTEEEKKTKVGTQTREEQFNDIYGQQLGRDPEGGILYYSPELLGPDGEERDSSKGYAGATLDDMFKDAEALEGNGESKIKQEDLQEFSRSIYNMAVAIGTAVTVLVGGILGVKFMLASAEEKADIKKMLMGYLIGCVLVFGSFAIWKIAVIVFQNM